MKKLLLILLLFPFISYGQRVVVSYGEYFTVAYPVGGANNGKLFSIQGNATAVSGMPGGVINASAGAHNVSFVDSTNHAWTYGDNNSYGQAGVGTTSSSSYGPTEILTDSAGNPFTNISYTVNSGNAYGWNCYFVKTDGSLW